MEDENNKKKTIIIAASVLVIIVLIVILIIVLKKPKNQIETPSRDLDYRCPLQAYSQEFEDGTLNCWYDAVNPSDVNEYQNKDYTCQINSDGKSYYCQKDIILEKEEDNTNQIPNNPSSLNSTQNNNVVENNSTNNNTINPQTGSNLMGIVWFIGLLAIGYSVYYFTKLVD